MNFTLGTFEDTKHTFMKTKLVILALIVFGSSCQNKELAQHKYSPKDFEQVGLMHTQGLDFVIASLNQGTFIADKNGRTDGKRTLPAILIENRKAAFAFTKQQISNLTTEQEKLLNDNFLLITQKGIDHVNRVKLRGVSARVAVSDLANSIVNEVSQHLTQGQIEKLQLIANALSTQSGDIEAIMSNLADVENQVYSLPTEEQPVIFGAISIARSSAKYWKSNYELWQQQINQMLIDDGKGSLGGKVELVDSGAVAVCDVGCGALMALGCYLSGPVGWAFSIKAVGGAAVVGSGIAAAIM